MLRRLAILTVLALGTSCVHTHELVAAPAAEVAPGSRVAEQTVEGVHVAVDPEAWRSGHVRDVLRPALVRIENGSDHPLRIAYSQFTLSDGSGSGFRAQALPPFQVAVQNASTEVVPVYPWTGFRLAPWQARFYHPGFPVWSGPLAFEPGFYATWGPTWPTLLPDRDVLRRALPEGVEDPGGKIAGFLYFHDQPKGKALSFRAALVDARTNETFGTVDIPFTVR